jgi:hypothetical protein
MSILLLHVAPLLSVYQIAGFPPAFRPPTIMRLFTASYPMERIKPTKFVGLFKVEVAHVWSIVINPLSVCATHFNNVGCQNIVLAAVVVDVKDVDVLEKLIPLSLNAISPLSVIAIQFPLTPPLIAPRSASKNNIICSPC